MAQGRAGPWWTLLNGSPEQVGGLLTAGTEGEKGASEEGAGLDRITAFCSLQSRFRAGGRRQDARCPGSGGQRGRTRDMSVFPKPEQSHGRERV